MKLLSVIVPCYNEEENVPYFYEEFIKNEIDPILFENAALLGEKGDVRL